MCALAGLMVPRQTLVADLSYDQRVLLWTLLIESGHIPLRTLLGNCSRDLYRPLRLRLLAWAQQVVFQDLSPHLGTSASQIKVEIHCSRSWLCSFPFKVYVMPLDKIT